MNFVPGGTQKGSNLLTVLALMELEDSYGVRKEWWMPAAPASNSTPHLLNMLLQLELSFPDGARLSRWS